MVRIYTGAAVLAALMASGAAHAQSTYATYDRPVAASTSVSTGERVERVYSAPVYEPYKPSAADETGYSAATEPLPFAAAPAYQPAPISQDGGGRPYGQPVDVTPTDGAGGMVADPFALTPPAYGGETASLQPSQSFAASPAPAADGEIGFQQESETSRLLLALEETYAKRIADVKASNAAQRKAMLDQFEKDAADPEKVIGLAERMRSSMAQLDNALKAALVTEERQYNAAMLKVLDAAPSRVQ